MRDFLYNKSDVLIAVLIIVIAALVIFSRIGVLMNFSESLDDGASSDYVAPVLPSESGGQVSSDAGVSGNGAASGADSAVDDAAVGENAADPAEAESATGGADSATEEDVAAEAGGAPGEIVNFSINAGDSASRIADNLLLAGLIPDKQTFLSEVVAQKADTLLRIGTYRIPKGSTSAEIVDILTG
jgi:hypothetical protein